VEILVNPFIIINRNGGAVLQVFLKARTIDERGLFPGLSDSRYIVVAKFWKNLLIAFEF
jgi:hypothetical protein